jgi:hypothetical protein
VRATRPGRAIFGKGTVEAWRARPGAASRESRRTERNGETRAARRETGAASCELRDTSYETRDETREGAEKWRGRAARWVRAERGESGAGRSGGEKKKGRAGGSINRAPEEGPDARPTFERRGAKGRAGASHARARIGGPQGRERGPREPRGSWVLGVTSCETRGGAARWEMRDARGERRGDGREESRESGPLGMVSPHPGGSGPRQGDRGKEEEGKGEAEARVGGGTRRARTRPWLEF